MYGGHVWGTCMGDMYDGEALIVGILQPQKLRSWERSLSSLKHPNDELCKH